MTWTAVGGNTWYSTAADGSTITSGTKAWPAAATTIGDLGIMVVVIRGLTDPSVHSDWTLLHSETSSDTATSGQVSIYLYAHVYAGTAPDMTWVTPTRNVAGIQVYRHSSETAYTFGTVASQLMSSSTTTHTLTGGTSVSAADSLVIVAGGNGRAQGYTNTTATAPSTGSGAGSTTSAPSGTEWTERIDNGVAATWSYRASLFDAVLDSGSTGTITTTLGASSKGTLLAVAIRPGVAATISIDNPAERKVYNGVSGSATVSFSGTYTGADENVEIQIERVVGGAVEVAWTTIAASPTGGTWAGSVSIPRGGWYAAKVRKATTTDVTAQTTSTWGVGLIVGGLGQSHLQENSTEGTGTPEDRASDVETSTIAAMDTTGQGRIGLVNALIAACDCPVTYIEKGVSGTTADYWYTAGAPTTPYNTWADRVDAAGGELSALVWWQGDADAQSSITREDYIADVEAVEAQVQADFGAPLTVVVNLGRYGSGSDSRWTLIRQAHVALVEASADRRGVVTVDVTQDGDNQHFPAASHEILGERIAQCIAEYVGDAAYSRGPVITSATYSGADVVVTLSHDGGADISPSSSITGIDVLDNGTPATITAAVRESASSVRLTCSATLSGPVTVRAGYGAFPTVTGWVVDNSALALPLVSTDDAVTAVAVTAVTADLSGSYAIHAQVTADLAGSYTVDGSATAVTADLACSYAIHQQVTGDLSASYSILEPVTADLSASYAVLQAVTADLAGSYTIESSLTAVTADLAGSYAVHQQVTADLAGSYTIESSTTSVTADLAGSFAILGRLEIDLSGAYTIESDSGPADPLVRPPADLGLSGLAIRRPLGNILKPNV